MAYTWSNLITQQLRYKEHQNKTTVWWNLYITTLNSGCFFVKNSDNVFRTRSDGMTKFPSSRTLLLSFPRRYLWVCLYHDSIEEVEHVLLNRCLVSSCSWSGFVWSDVFVPRFTSLLRIDGNGSTFRDGEQLRIVATHWMNWGWQHREGKMSLFKYHQFFAQGFNFCRNNSTRCIDTLTDGQNHVVQLKELWVCDIIITKTLRAC